MLFGYGISFASRRLLRTAVPGFAAILLPVGVWATELDFGEALQDLETGEEVGTVHFDNASMTVSCRNHGGGPDLCIIFDSEAPSGGDFDLGTPNETFGGPGQGEGGEQGQEGENDQELGNIIIIAENDVDANDDGHVDEPDDESGGGVVRLEFSHAGRLSLTLIDVDDDEDEPRLVLWNEGELVDVIEGESLGDNSRQHFDLASSGDVDAVDIHLEGSTGIGEIKLNVLSVGVEPSSWSNIKQTYR